MGDNKKQEKKATRKTISLEIKMQVIRRLDSDERQSQTRAKRFFDGVCKKELDHYN